MRILLGIFCISVFFVFNACTSLNDYDDTPTVSVAQGSHGKEPSDAATFLFTMTAASKNDVTVNFTLAGTARMDVDYTNPGAILVIPKGATAATLSITPIDDTTFETPNRTIALTVAEGTGYKIGTNQATVEIQENEPAPAPPINRVPNIKTVSATRTEIHDRLTRIDFPLEVEDDGPLDQLTWNISPSSTLVKMEYVQSKWTFVVFPPEKSTGVYRFDLTASDGNSVSTSRTFVVEMTNQPMRLGTVSQDSKIFERDLLEIPPGIASDPDSDMLIYYIEETEKPQHGSLSLVDAQTGKCIYTAYECEKVETDICILSVTDRIDVQKIRVPVEIHPLPRVQIFPVQDVSESGTQAQFRLDLNKIADWDVVVGIHLSGSATRGIYNFEPDLSVVIPQGSTSAILNIVPKNDDDLNTDRSLIATLGACDGARPGSATVASVKILNDDFNQAPQVTTQTLTAHFTKPTFDLQAEDDLYGDPIRWEILSCTPGSATIARLSAAQGRVFFTPPTKSWIGSAKLSVRVSDNLGASSSATVTLTLTDVAAPQISLQSPNDSIPWDETLSVTVQASDADDDKVSLSATASHGTLKRINGGFEYDPTDEYVGSDILTITASDGVKSSTRTLNVKVVEPVPLITAITTTDSIDGSSPATFAILFSKSRPSKLVLTAHYSGTATQDVHFSATTSVILNGGATLATLSIKPINDADAVHQAPRTLTMTVSSTSASLLIADGDPNNPPQLDDLTYFEIQHDKKVEGEDAILETKNDTDVGAEYRWSLREPLPTGCSATLSAVGHGKTAQFTFVPPPSATGIFILHYSVTDEYLSPVSATITVEVKNHRPSIISDNAFTIARGTSLEYTPQADDAQDNDELTWSCSSASHGRIDPTKLAAKTILYIPEGNFYGEDSFVLSVWDHCESATQMVRVRVERPVVSVSVEKHAWQPSGQGSFVIQIPRPLPEALVIERVLRGAAPAHYTSSPLQNNLLVIRKGTTQAKVTINISPAANLTVPETLEFVVLPAGETYDLSVSASTATMELRPQEKPLVSLAKISDGHVSDSATQPIVFSVVLSQHADTDIPVSLLATGSAQAGLDYELPNPFVVTVPYGSLSATKAISVKRNPAIDGNKTLILEAKPSSFYTPGSPSTFIIVDETTPVVSLETVSNGRVGSATQAPILRVQLSQHAKTDLCVSLLPSGSAVAGLDYVQPNPFEVTIPKGSQSATLPITVQLNPAIDGDVSLVVSASATEAYRVNSSASQATLMIVDGTIPVVSLETVSHGRVGSATQAPVLLARLSQHAKTDLRVALLPSGSAVANVDYVLPNPFEVTILKGSTSATLPITLKLNPAIDGDVSLVLSASAASIYTINSSASQATLLIVDGTTPLVSLETVSNGRVGSATQAPILRVRLSQHAKTDLQVSLSATGTAIAGLDYVQPNPFEVTIPKGSQSATLPITVQLNPAIDGDVSLVVSASAANIYNINPSASQATLIIEDCLLPVVSVNNERDGSFDGSATIMPILRVSLARKAKADVTVSLSATGTAIADVDYEAFTQITIPQGTNSATMAISLKDTISSGDKTLVVSASAAAIYEINPSASQAILNIDDDRIPPAPEAITWRSSPYEKQPMCRNDRAAILPRRVWLHEMCMLDR